MTAGSGQHSRKPPGASWPSSFRLRYLESWFGILAVLIAVGLALLMACRAPVVSAHAHYDHSTPAIGEVLQTAPARVDIYTDQDLAKVGNADTIVVTNSAGQQVDTGTTYVDDSDRKHFWVGLRPNLLPGRYVVSFTTLSDVDNDRDRGRFAFYVGHAPTAQDLTLDRQLTSSVPTAATSSSHTGLIIGIVAVAVAIIVLPAGAALVLRRRRRH